MGMDFIYRNKNALSINCALKYRAYKTFSISSKINTGRFTVLLKIEPKFRPNIFLSRDKSTASLQTFLYISYYESLYLNLYNWIFRQPGLHIFLIPSGKIINNSREVISDYKFKSLNHKDYIINYKLLEKLLILS